MRQVRWWLIVPSLALVLAAAWVLLTAWGPVTAGHPAYLLTLLLAGLLGVVGLVLALTRR